MNESPTQEALGERIIVIDDDYAMRLSCRQILAKTGYEVETYGDGAQGLDAVLTLKPDLVVVDLKMPGISGMDVIERVREIDPQIVLVVITGYPTIGSAVEAIKAGAFDFLPKPFSPDELRLVVKRALGRRRLLLESRRLEVEREFLKRRFVTLVSHQLKSPLAAIHQYLEVLDRLEDTEGGGQKRREWYRRCLARSEELLQLVSDWLTLSQIESADLARRRERIDVVRTIQGILETYRDSAEESGVTLVSQLAEKELPVAGDPSCVSVLFDNLIVNAIKYNRPGGRVELSGELLGGEVTVFVTDTGVGIPEEYRDFLFDEFFRVRGEAGKKTSGTGLGLPICRRIVSEMGGKVEVESEVGVGSTFRVRLPAYREEAGSGSGEISESPELEVGASA